MPPRIYLDHAATTPLHPAARAAMEPWLVGPGNPSSLHQEGREARQAVDLARESISRRLGCDFAELLFTASGTEAVNLAILGTALAARGGPQNRVLMSAAEHHAVLHTQPLLEALGFQVEFFRVDRGAVADLEDLAKKIGDDVLLACAMHANNEVGTIQPVREIAALCRASGALFFCDTVQTFGALNWRVADLGADLVAICAHKVYGPKGVGGIYVKAGTPIKPWTVGGGQERELRAGTENVAGIVGFAAAADTTEAGTNTKREARDAFLNQLSDHAEPTIPSHIACLEGHAHLRFPDLSAESMLIVLDRMGVAASSGAACSSGSLEPSHVLLAAGFSESEAKEGLRFTFGVGSTIEEAGEAAARVVEAAKQVRR